MGGGGGVEEVSMEEGDHPLPLEVSGGFLGKMLICQCLKGHSVSVALRETRERIFSDYFCKSSAGN